MRDILGKKKKQSGKSRKASGIIPSEANRGLADKAISVPVSDYDRDDKHTVVFSTSSTPRYLL